MIPLVSFAVMIGHADGRRFMVPVYRGQLTMDLEKRYDAVFDCCFPTRQEAESYIGIVERRASLEA